MKTKINKSCVSKVISVFMVLALFVSLTSVTAFAAETNAAPQATLNADNSITFSNLDSVAVNEIVEFQVTDAEGNPATVGIQRVQTAAIAAAAGTEWKVWYTGVTINAHFYMTVDNNRVTSVYDDWILIIGGTYDNSSLTSTSTYGKLSFRVEAYGGIMAATCWLKGTVTGSNNEVTVSYQM